MQFSCHAFYYTKQDHSVEVWISYFQKPWTLQQTSHESLFSSEMQYNELYTWTLFSQNAGEKKKAEKSLISPLIAAIIIDLMPLWCEMLLYLYLLSSLFIILPFYYH